MANHPQPVDIQEKAAQAKIESYSSQEDFELGRFQGQDADAQLESWRSFKEEVPNFAKGLPANALGIGVDLMTMITAAGYGGYNYLVHGTDYSFTMPDDLGDVPGSSVSIGRAFGADTESVGFLISAFANPEGPLFAVLKAMKAYLGLAKSATVIQAITAGSIAAKRVPGELARKSEALRLTKGGMKEGEVFMRTGWWQDEDGWKFLISDKGASVNMERINKAGKNVLAEIGDEFAVQGELQDFLLHPKYYEAYPEYATMPTTMWARRVEDAKDGTQRFEIFNAEKLAQRITGRVTEKMSGAKAIDIFNPAEGVFDDALSVVMHEANHLPQVAEGFDAGASTAKFLERIESAAETSISAQLAQDMLDGKIARGMDVSEQTRYAVSLAQRHRTQNIDQTIERVGKELAKDMSERAMKIKAGHTQVNHNRNVRDVRIMMEELGDIPEGFAPGTIDTMLRKLNFQDQADLAFRRYRNQGGEIGSRLTEHLMGKTAAEVRASGEVPSLQGPIAERIMEQGDVVLGDRARELVPAVTPVGFKKVTM